MKASILVVDDESAIREMICMVLEQNGFRCQEAADAHKAEAKMKESMPDLILLDWMMPGMSGLDLVKRLRRTGEAKSLPIIMLSAKAEENDVINGLSQGADDYITKPFSTRELLARISALLRRSDGVSEDELLRYRQLEMDLRAHRVMSGAVTITMGPTEFKLLQFFMQHPNRVFNRQQLLDNVWGHNVYVEDRTVDVHIRRLRKVLSICGHADYVQTVRGAGYRFS